MKKPYISVIMGVYNCAPTLQEALDSLYAQSYQDFEIIICDDGSTDDTYSIAEKNARQNNCIKLLRNEKNYGLNKTLNKCLAVAEGELIARMDGDDTCSPERFAKEVEILNSYPEYAIVSTKMSMYDENGIWGETSQLITPQPKDFLYRTQFAHAASMVRKGAFDAVGGYSVEKRLLRVEDYHLWVKMYAKGYRGYNIQEPLYQMRDDRNATSRKKFKYRLNEFFVKKEVIRLFGLPFYNYIYCLRPLLVGCMPNFIFDYIHKTKLR